MFDPQVLLKRKGRIGGQYLKLRKSLTNLRFLVLLKKTRSSGNSEPSFLQGSCGLAPHAPCQPHHPLLFPTRTAALEFTSPFLVHTCLLFIGTLKALPHSFIDSFLDCQALYEALGSQW